MGVGANIGHTGQTAGRGGDGRRWGSEKEGCLLRKQSTGRNGSKVRGAGGA